MKVGIMTFHTALNYGAVLQTYALYRIIKEKGHEVRVIDYIAPFNEKRFAPKSFSYFLNLRTIYNVLFRNGYEIYQGKGFKDFVINHIELTDPLYNEEQLRKQNNSFDTFISGSDQVWNLACTEGDEMYYLPFVLDDHKRNSYAASIGYNKIPESDVDKYATLMKGFNHISVREASGLDIVKALTGRDAELVLDPTLLINKEKWSQIADYSRAANRKNYLLLYLMSEDKTLIKKAKKYAKDNNLEVVYITQRLFKLNGADNLRNITPEQWIGLFLKASVVATNSYHGLLFSINFNKPFITRYIPRSIANSRMETILDVLDLHSRRIDSQICTLETKIDYGKVNEKLQTLREKSLGFLDKILNNGEQVN